MIELNIEEINISDIFVLFAKTKYGNRNLNKYGDKYLVTDKKSDCVLLESLKEGRKFTRWVNVYYDEHFYIIGRFIFDICLHEKKES